MCCSKFMKKKGRVILRYLYKRHTHNSLKFAIVRELTSAAQNMEKSERVILYCLCLYIM